VKIKHHNNYQPRESNMQIDLRTSLSSLICIVRYELKRSLTNIVLCYKKVVTAILYFLELKV